jgi:hypothetical protein
VVLEVVNFVTPVEVLIVCVCVFVCVCRAKDCDTMQLSVDEDEEKELQVCQFVASFIFALSVSLVILSTELPYLPECKTVLI